MNNFLNIKENKKHLFRKIFKKNNNNPNQKVLNKLKIDPLNIRNIRQMNNNKENLDKNILTDLGNLTLQNETRKIKIEKNAKNINNKKQKYLENNKYSKNTYNNNVLKLQKKVYHNRKNISSIPLFENYMRKTLTSKNSNVNKKFNTKRTSSIYEHNKSYICNQKNSVIISSNYYKGENFSLRENYKSADISPRQKKIIKNHKNKILKQKSNLKNNSMVVAACKKKTRGVIRLPISNLINKLKNIQKINTDSSKTINNFEKEIVINKKPQKVEEYLEDIYNYLKSIDNINLPKKDYMKLVQLDINEKMRKILIDWLVEVHYKFKLLPETLFLTINMIDKYLSKSSINRKYLQLLGITSMFIASKYEDIYPPEIKDFIFVTNNTYSKDELIKLESDILDKIEFNLTFPTSLRFLEIFKEMLNLKEIDYLRCRYFIEIALFDYKCCHFPPSLIAASSVLLNHKINKNKNIKYSDNRILETIGYNFEELNPCLVCLINGIHEMTKLNNKYSSIRRKFEKEEFMKVSKESINIDNIFIGTNKIKI